MNKLNAHARYGQFHNKKQLKSISNKAFNLLHLKGIYECNHHKNKKKSVFDIYPIN